MNSMVKSVWMVVAAMMLSCHQMAAQQTAYVMGKVTDHWQVGLNGGVEVLTTHTQVAYNLNPKAGLRLSRSLTPVLGMAIDAAASFRNKPFLGADGVVKASNLNLLAVVNVGNLVKGYKGQPRRLEVMALGGMGWGHLFGLKPQVDSEGETILPSHMDKNAFMGKVALDLAYNLGQEREWQVYLEPCISYHLDADGDVKFNINRSCVGLMAGINYKLRNSDGRRHMVGGKLRSQQEIDLLNQRINEMTAELKAKEAQMARDARQLQEMKERLEKLGNMKPSNFDLDD